MISKSKCISSKTETILQLVIISCTDYFRLQYYLTDAFLWCTVERGACFTLVVVLGFPTHDIFVLSLFDVEVSTVATAICGLANTNTLLKVKVRLGNSDASAHTGA